MNKDLLNWQKKINQQYNVTTYDSKGRVTNYGANVNEGATVSPHLSDEKLGKVLVSNQKIENKQVKIDEINLKLNDIATKKDELKIIEASKIGTKGTTVQIKTTQNALYRSLQSTESELIAKKNQLEQEIQVQQDKIEQASLTDQAGKTFSAGISLDPVMDYDKEISQVPTAPAMSSLERAEKFGKEDTILNPNFTFEDVAQGLTEQGKSYLGGDYTPLDRTVASPILDLKDAIFNPEGYQRNVDYGYTNMGTSAKEISKEPDKFVGNLLADIGVGIATFGAGKAVVKGIKPVVKIIKDIHQSKNAKPTNPIGVTDELPKVNLDNADLKTVVNTSASEPSGVLKNTRNYKKLYSSYKRDEARSDSEFGNPYDVIDIDDLISNNKGGITPRNAVVKHKEKAMTAFNKRVDSVKKRNELNSNIDSGKGGGTSPPTTKEINNVDRYSSKYLNPSGTVDLKPVPKQVTKKSSYTKALSQGVSIDGYNFAKSMASKYIKNPKSTPKDFVKKEILIDGADGQMAVDISSGVNRGTIEIKSYEKIIPPKIMKLAFEDAKAEIPRKAQYIVRQVEGEASEIEKTYLNNIIRYTNSKKQPVSKKTVWDDADNAYNIRNSGQPIPSVKTNYKKQSKNYIYSLNEEKKEFEEFAKFTGIKQKPPNVRYTTEFGKTLTGVAGASAIGGATFAGLNNKKKSKNKKSNNIFNFKY